jgi:hypothetical protein
LVLIKNRVSGQAASGRANDRQRQPLGYHG